MIESEGPSPVYRFGGSDAVAGGEGNDEIHTSDDHRDTVSCGPGTDRVTADVTDDVAADCETVERQFEPPWVRADGRPIGVSIDDGATYTNSLDVQVTALGPDVATGLRISSDSGFANPLSVLRNASETYPFMLASSGPEQKPKTVYVRFDGPGLDPTVTFTDDIIFDQTPPSVDSARIVGRNRGGVLIRLRASDGTSGVETAQFAHNRSKPWESVPYQELTSLPRKPNWARVGDGAGNASGWHRVRP